MNLDGLHGASLHVELCSPNEYSDPVATAHVRFSDDYTQVTSRRRKRSDGRSGQLFGDAAAWGDMTSLLSLGRLRLHRLLPPPRHCFKQGRLIGRDSPTC